MKIRAFVIVGAAIVVAGSLIGYKTYGDIQKYKAMQAMVQPTATVATVQAHEEQWRARFSAVANLESIQGVTVSSEVNGKVVKTHFESGAFVEAGAALVDLDDSSEQAQLLGLQAAARLAEINCARARELMQRETIAQYELDTAEASLAQANAAVEQVEALIGKKHIKAPFPGKLGIRLVSAGKYVAAGVAFVQLEDTRTIYADFGVPQQELSLLHPGMALTLVSDAYPGRVFEGRVEAINPRVSEATRNLKVRAVFDNSDGSLMPGMFGHVKAEAGEAIKVQVVPSTAIVYSTYGDFVYLVEKSDAGALCVKQQFVQIGEKRGDLVAVKAGLKAGDTIVSAGQMKLRNGALIRVENSVPVDANLKPQPDES